MIRGERTVNCMKEVITSYLFAVYIAVDSPMSGVQLLQRFPTSY